MSTVLYSCLLNGEPFTYRSAEDGSPIAYGGTNQVEEHVPVTSDAVVVTVAAVEPPPKLTKLAFDNRFTIPELTGIEMASLDIPTANEQQRTLAASLRIIKRKQEMATCIDLSLPDAGYFLQILVGVGLLAPHRPAQILNPVAAEGELYRG